MMDGARERAESFFERKQRQQTEGEQAWSEYRARQAAIVENTARLRQLRLARDAAKSATKSAPAKNRD
jgi:predicted Zn-dependent protease